MTNSENKRHGLITPCFNKCVEVRDGRTVNQIFAADGQLATTVECENGKSIQLFSGFELKARGITGLVGDQLYNIECDGANVAFIWTGNK